jgi:transposase-like protein
MGGFRPPVKKEIKDEILAKVKQGEKVPLLASQYGVSSGAVYGWLSDRASAEPGTLELSRLRRENQDLYRLLGKATAELERSKKNRAAR